MTTTQKIERELLHDIWSLYCLAELVDRNGTDYDNFVFSLSGTGLSLPKEKEELTTRIDYFILKRWLFLKEASEPDARSALEMSQVKFSQLRSVDPGLHSKWKVLRDAKSKYSTNIWRDINLIPDRLDGVFTAGASSKELNLDRVRQKLRMISHEMDQFGNLRLFRAIDVLVTQLHARRS